MAGIAFELRALTRNNGFIKPVMAYSHAGFLVAGPWILTVLALAGITMALKSTTSWYDIQLFRSITIYNFCGSLILTGPIALLTTRYVADQIYQKQVKYIVFSLMAGLAVMAVILMPMAIVFHGFLADMPIATRYAAIVNFGLISAIWICLPFLSILRKYSAISLAFFAGTVLSIAISTTFNHYLDDFLILNIFNAALATVLMLIISRIFSEYAVSLTIDPSIWQFVQEKWELAVIGFCYFAGMWADKLILWHLASDHNLQVAGILSSLPVYDATLFKAQLLAIPGFIYFFVHAETGFYERSQVIFNSLEQHATLRFINTEIDALSAFVINKLLVISLFYVALVAMLILALPAMHAVLGLTGVQISIFRYGIIGTATHTVFLFSTIFLLYCDLRRQVVLLTTLFLVLNSVLTVLFASAGEIYFGLGYALAAAIALIAALVVLRRELPWLAYHTFVTNNTSLRS